MKKERLTLPLRSIRQNTGQLPWLPSNPREWTQDDIRRTAKSIHEDPDFLDDRPILVVPGRAEGTFVAFAGNLRLTACNLEDRKTAPCVIYTPESDEDKATIKRRAMKDNGSFGAWDFDALANEWDDLPLTEWGVPSWDTTKMELSTKGREGEDGYDEFVEKFEQKLTTDDCYTPQPVYDAILAWAMEHIEGVERSKIVRPFFPGGDYTNLEQYKGDSFVLDNPPFSILSQIVRFYCEHGIRFFIFAPSLTLFTATDCDVTYLVTDSEIEYENGAKVRTGFITNQTPGVRIWLCPELGNAVDDAQADEDKTKTGFSYPDNLITAAILGKIVKRGIELRIPSWACFPVKGSDSAEEQGRQIYGGGFLLSDMAAAERAAATRLNLSDREKAIIARLNEAEAEHGRTIDTN